MSTSLWYHGFGVQGYVYHASVSRPSHRKPAGVDRAHGIAVNVSNPPRNFPFGHFGAIIAKNVSRIEAEARRLRRYPQ